MAGATGDRAVAPGTVVLDLATAGGGMVRLGSGLLQEGDVILATKAGTLRSGRKNKLWVESSQKRYLPAQNEPVVGIVLDRRGESFDVDVRGPGRAALPALAFESATRRNRPNLKAGACVYARVARVHPDMDPELACTDEGGRAAGFGPLVGGYMFECNTGLARLLLSTPTWPVLAALEREGLSFELAVGLNGRVWVNSAAPQTTILVANAILDSQYCLPDDQPSMVKRLLKQQKY